MLIKKYLNLILFLLCILILLFIQLNIYKNLNLTVIDEMQYLFGIEKGSSYSFYPSSTFFMINRFITLDYNTVSNARILNKIFLMLGFFPIYYFCSIIANKFLKFSIYLFYFFGPYSVYSNYVMPEILFGCLMGYCLLIIDLYFSKQKNLYFIIFAVLIGIGLGVKSHSIVLLIVFIFLMFIKNFKVENTYRFIPLIKSTFVLLISFSVYLIIRYLEGLGVNNSIVGGYSTIISSNDFNIVIFLKNLAILTFPHIIIMMLLILPSLYISNFKNINIFKFDIEKKSIIFIALFSYITLSIIYSSLVAGVLPGDTNSRVHTRYYSWCIPFGLIAMISVLERNIAKFNLLFLLNIYLILISIYKIFKYFFDISYVDNPDHAFMFSNLSLFIVLLIPFIKIEKINRISLIILLCTLYSSCSSHLSVSSRIIDTPPDWAGKFICNNNFDKYKFVLVHDIISYGFLYFNCSKIKIIINDHANKHEDVPFIVVDQFSNKMYSNNPYFTTIHPGVFIHD